MLASIDAVPWYLQIVFTYLGIMWFKNTNDTTAVQYFEQLPCGIDPFYCPYQIYAQSASQPAIARSHSDFLETLPLAPQSCRLCALSQNRRKRKKSASSEKVVDFALEADSPPVSCSVLLFLVVDWAFL